MNRKGRILVVEDDSVQRRIIVQMLRSRYLVSAAESGEECLVEVGRFFPDVVVLDVNLTGIDGLETTRRIRALDSDASQAKVILVSARTDLSDRLQGYASGADDYIPKPFHQEELHAKIEVLLRLRSTDEVAKLKSQFLNLLSHETRTPLTSIIGPAQALEQDGLKDEDRKMFARMILESAHRLTDLVDKATNLCDIKAGRGPVDRARLELGSIGERVVNDLRPTADLKEVKLVTEVVYPLDIDGNIQHIELLLRTLIQRAILVTKESGRVRVQMDTVGGHVQIAVRDQGEPIDAEMLPDLFEDFLVPNVDHHTGSLGLDLALCASIVRQHGGDIDVHSDEEGNLFTCLLPHLVTAGETDAIPLPPAQGEDPAEEREPAGALGRSNRSGPAART